MTADTARVMPLLEKILTDTVKLDAPCRQTPELFDPQGVGEDRDAVVRRHESAVRVCRFVCPALADCESWVDALAPAKRPSGVVAGRRPAIRTPGRPSGRLP